MANVSYARLKKNTGNVDQETIRWVFKDYFISKSKRDLPALYKTLSIVAQIVFFWVTGG